MASKEENPDELGTNPIIIYLNRLQKQMVIITDLLYNSRKPNPNILKRCIIGLLHNLPPKSKNEFSEIEKRLKSNNYTSINALSDDYQKIHAWAYTKLFQELNFGLTPTITLKGDKSAPEHKPLDPTQTSRI